VSSTNPVQLLFSTYRRQVLALLLLRPDESFHVREIARLAGVPAGSLHRELRVLADADLLIREPVGNQVRYRANRGGLIYAELAEIFRKTLGLADVLRDTLGRLRAKIDLAFVFGSLAQGKERPTSDVDVFIIGAASFESVVRAFMETHVKLGREVNPVVMSKRDFRAKHRVGDRFTTRIAREQKIFLIGSEDDFRKLIEDRTA
jgi:predicted nucleotidyltransferase